MSITEKLFRPLLRADPARPLITYYDDATGVRIELSRATMANWASKTANWLRDELDVEAGTPVGVLLPTHWQTVGVLLGSWWCGASVRFDPAGTEVCFTAPGGDAPGARTVAAASLDPMGRGLSSTPPGVLDYISEARVHGDDFLPYEPVPGDTPALGESTVDELLDLAAKRAAELGFGADDRILSTVDWNTDAGVLDGLLAVLAGGGSLVQCVNLDESKLAARKETEKITRELR
ncbi:MULTISPECIES: TIGR03089 family protein [unclassified Crossiella]|uniref:TIGR03089 family protein n=1 Tax=unclassified Crossiella TaxID=2620835 RepID=UPI0020002E88|nr:MULTISPECIES: TIGR03089 family protein [unclassified Crossiella]MCK2238415.1 TIGR03089 family protein [Crossiella sp. S99.2]MCK2256455.1 TIGR03089 family protein [Crossiella sp. S99.1]